MNSISFSNKLLTFSFSFIFLVGTILFPRSAHAQYSDFADLALDVGSFIENTLQEVTGFESFLKEIGLDKVAFIVAQTMAQKLTSSITNSLNGGASGDEPEQFIKDFGKHFENIAFQEGQKYVDDLFADTNNPFSTQIGSSLVSSFSSGNTSALDNFSLGTILGAEGNVSSGDVQSKIDEFSNDATVGGYSGLFALGFPENTPIGSNIIAQEELAKKIETAKENAETELTSSGYTGKKTCTPTVESYQDSPTANEESVPSDCAIESPAGLNEESGNIAISESTDRLQNVDELGELVSSTITQLASTLISKGLSEVGSIDLASQRNTTYGGALDVQDYFATQQQAGNTRSFPSVIVDFGKELAPAMEATQREIDTLKETLEVFKASPQIAHDLDTCTPGPDRGWENRMQKYYTKQTQGVIEKVAKDEDAGDEEKALEYLDSRMKNAIQEERALVNDALTNLPGAGEANLLLGAYEQKAVKFQQIFNQLVTKQSSFNSLRSILITAKGQAQGYGLILSKEDWDLLNDTAKISLYQEVLDEFPEGDPVETQTSLTTQDRERMLESVLPYEWSKWEELMDSTLERKEIKRTLFLRFNEMRSDLSSNVSAARSQSFLEEIKEDQSDMGKTLGQCLLLRRIFGILPVSSVGYFTEVPLSYAPTTELSSYDPTSVVRVHNMTQAQAIAKLLRDGVYTSTTVSDLKSQLANLFPDYKTLIGNILMKPSILDNIEADELSFKANAFGDELAVKTPRIIKDIFTQDAEGELFCRIPKAFGTTPFLFANGGRTWIDMHNFSNGNTPKVYQSDGSYQSFDGFGGSDDDVKGYKPVLCSSPKAVDNLVAAIESSGDPISKNILEWRNKFLKSPHVWYFSNGLESYIFFDKTNAGA